MSLADYLAQNYLQASKSSRKKQKKKGTTSVTIEEPSETIDAENASDNDQDEPEKVFSKPVSKSKGWKSVDDKVTAQPLVRPRPEATMNSGALAGLQSGKDVDLQIKEKKAQAYQDYVSSIKDDSHSKTVYRNKEGKVIDGRELQEMAQLAKLRKREELKKQDDAKRELNRSESDKLKEAEVKEKLAEAKASHEDKQRKREQEMKSKITYDDPMLAFDTSLSNKLTAQMYVSPSGRKLYPGVFPDNRFSIRPGYRWDGVDRSNGFELKWFRRQEQLKQESALRYTMQEDY